MKNIITTSALITATLFTGSAIANTTSDESPLTGPYIGIYGGYGWNDTQSQSLGVATNVEGWDGGVFAGYKFGSMMESSNEGGFGMHAAIEAFYGLSNAEDTTAGLQHVKKKDDWGISFRPGFSFIDQMTDPLGIAPYAILGYRNTKFESNSAGFNGSDRYDGFELGAGTELIAYGNTGMRLEYSHIWYDEQGGVDIDSDEIRLGLNYHF